VSEFHFYRTPPAVGPLKLRVRELREAAGLKPGELAAQAGCATSTIVRLESGHGRPNEKDLAKLATALGVTPAELVATP
jgi:transcriptional regulator with XRE-family HTH domain